MAGLDAMQKKEKFFPMPGSEPRFLGFPYRCPALMLVKLQTSEKLRLVCVCGGTSLFVLDVYTVCALKPRFVMCGREHITFCFLVRLDDGEVVF